MRFLIISHTAHCFYESRYYAYGPYVLEMNLWLKYVDEVQVVAPLREGKPSGIMQAYEHQAIGFYKVPTISLLSFSELLKTIFRLPLIFIRIFKAMNKADHIHLRCPGNIGLIGCFAQVFFPKKIKTTKYAGNWDPKANQPCSYRLQKWTLANTFLTKNMQVLVYGDWPEQSKNIKPFFTATYSEIDPDNHRDENESEIVKSKRFKTPFKFLFVGTLSVGKQPLYAVKLVEAIKQSGIRCSLKIYGEGEQRQKLEKYIHEHKLEQSISLFGNQSATVVEKAYQSSHFLILPSKSEGWPKVVAEAMFWGCIPLVTSISCVPWMLDKGNRGIILTTDLKQDAAEISELLSKKEQLPTLSENAKNWSRQYTLERFEEEIGKLLRE